MPSILGAYTAVHVTISLFAILIGFPAILQMLRGELKSSTIFGFFLLTALTSLTGFGFPASSITPAHVFGALTLALLATAYFARSRATTKRVWRRVFLMSAIASQYLNTFVLVVQAFLKIGILHDLAPTQSEPPFLVAQLLVIALFLLPVWSSFTLTKSLPS